MSELPPGSVNIEDETPAPAAAEAVQTPPAAAPPPASPEEPKPAEVESVDVGGEKYVPVAALVAERKQRQALTATAQENETLKAQLAEAAPALAFLKANPHLLTPRPLEPPPAAAPPSVDPDAEEAARLMDFYKADGTLDLDKGARWLKLQDKRAGRVAQETVQPYAQTTARERSVSNFQKAVAFRGPDGVAADPKVLQQLWAMHPAEDTANEQMAGAILIQALGMGTIRPKGPQPPVAPPLVTEPIGGPPRRPTQLSALETTVATNKGIKPSDWAKNQEGYTPGRPTVLED